MTLAIGLMRPAGRNGGADQALHLVAEARNGSPMAASGLKSQLRHESRKRGAKLQLSIPGSHRFGRHPDENQPRIAAIGQPGPADIGDTERKIAVGTEVLCAGLLPVWQSGLNEEFGDEANGSGIIGALAEIVLCERQRDTIETYSLILVQDHAA